MTTTLTHITENHQQENPMDLDDTERGAQMEEVNGNGLDIDSFIDEEFSNIFDSSGTDDDFEDNPSSNASKSSLILAQQLQILKETNIDEVEASPEVFTPTEKIRVDGEIEVSSTARSKDGEGVASSSVQTQKFICENCHRLQSTSQSLYPGIGDGNKDDITTVDINIRDSVVTDDKIIDILEELGTCWKQLGPILHIATAKLQNIDTDNNNSKDKACDMVTTWKQQQGKYATVGCLEQGLLRIKRKDIADKFIGIIGLESTAPPSIQHMDKPLNLNIRVDSKPKWLKSKYNLRNVKDREKHIGRKRLGHDRKIIKDATFTYKSIYPRKITSVDDKQDILSWTLSNTGRNDELNPDDSINPPMLDGKSSKSPHQDQKESKELSESCSEQFRRVQCSSMPCGSMNFDDTTPEELAAYFEQLLHIPKPMSAMAEMMYT